MRRLINLVKLYFSVIKKDGILLGVKNAAKLTKSSGGNALEFNMASYLHSVWYRPGSTDAHLLKSIFYIEEYRVEMRDVAPKVILDLGANAGYATVFFAHEFSEAKIYSVEPEQSNFDLLVKNTNSFSNVLPVRGAIWGGDKRLVPKYENSDAWSFSLREAQENVSVEGSIEGISLSSFIDRHDIDSIDLLKIDIEGGELPLFESDTSWLHQVKILVIELHDRKVKGCSQALYTALVKEGISFTQKNMGYNTIIYNERFFK